MLVVVIMYRAHREDVQNASRVTVDPISGNEEIVRKSLVDLASYARYLEQQLGVVAPEPVAGSSKAVAVTAAKPAVRSPAELEAAAEKLRKAAVSGIKKQMSVSNAYMRVCVIRLWLRYALMHMSMYSGSRRARLVLRSGPTMASAPTRPCLA